MLVLALGKWYEIEGFRSGGTSSATQAQSLTDVACGEESQACYRSIYR